MDCLFKWNLFLYRKTTEERMRTWMELSFSNDKICGLACFIRLTHHCMRNRNHFFIPFQTKTIIFAVFNNHDIYFYFPIFCQCLTLNIFFIEHIPETNSISLLFKYIYFLSVHDAQFSYYLKAEVTYFDYFTHFRIICRLCCLQHKFSADVYIDNPLLRATSGSFRKWLIVIPSSRSPKFNKLDNLFNIRDYLT